MDRDLGFRSKTAKGFVKFRWRRNGLWLEVANNVQSLRYSIEIYRGGDKRGIWFLGDVGI